MKSTNPTPLALIHRRGSALWWLGLGLFVLLALPYRAAFALASDADQPILIAADSVDIDDRKGTSIYRGNVVIRQGSMRLNADEVTVFQQGRKAEKFIAVGKPVQFRQKQENNAPDFQGQALRAEYVTASEELTLIGNALLFQGKDSFRSDRIIYDRINALVKGGASAEGKQRVQVTIEPKSGS